jgi:hypothetical protein
MDLKGGGQDELTESMMDDNGKTKIQNIYAKEGKRI